MSDEKLKPDAIAETLKKLATPDQGGNRAPFWKTLEKGGYKIERLRKLLLKAVDTIEGLADQQAMVDLHYEPTLNEIKRELGLEVYYLEPRYFEIWCEGYATTGDRAKAHLMGRGFGHTFREAVIQFMEFDEEHKKYFNEEDLTHWGCRLFDNEEDARASFG